MPCQDIQRQLKTFFEDLLAEEEYQEICGHLEQCAPCRQYAISTGSLSYLLKELGDIDIPKDLSATIRFRTEKRTDYAALSSSHDNNASSSAHLGYKVLAVIAVALLIAGGVFLGRGKGARNASTGTPEEIHSEEEAVTVEVKVGSKQERVSHEEGELLYGQLQMIADSLGVKAGVKEAEKETEPLKPVPESDSVLGQASGTDAAPPDEALQKTTAFHWHIPYAREAERDQLVGTVKILEINPDYQDQDFLVFKATGRQLKLLTDGIQFTSKAALDVPSVIGEGTDSEVDIPVSIYFIRNTADRDEFSNIPIVKKDGVFVSLDQNVSTSGTALDWHLLIIPKQRGALLDVVRQGGGSIVYESEHAAIFSISGARIGKLMDQVRSTSGVFADFGQTELSESAQMRETVKVLIRMKEQ